MAPTKEVIRITQHGVSAWVFPKSFLGDTFDIYRKACATGGAKYNGDRKCNEIRLDGVPRLVDALTNAGFEVELDPDLVATLSARAAAAKMDVIEADARALALNAALAKKGLTLFPFQHAGIKWLAPRRNALLCDQMGTGKSAQTLLAAPSGAPTLVICPAVAKGVWVREVAKWRPEWEIAVLDGRGSFRWPAAGEMVIVNYDILPDPETLAKAPHGVLVICDEFHAVKGGTKTRRGARTRAVCQAARAADGRTWGLTATPLLNKPQEMWALLTTLGLEREVFGDWNTFLRLCGGVPGKWGGIEWNGEPDPSVGERLKRVSLRRMQKDVLQDLPTLSRKTHTVELDSKTKKLCEKALAALTKAGMTLEEAVQKAMASDGAVTFEGLSAARKALSMAKAHAALDLVEQYEEQDEPVVVFGAHVASLELIAAREGWALITGETSSAKRSEIEDAFQAGKLKGIAASIKAGGVAITLTRSHEALFIDREWTPALNQQAEYRLLRIGQKNAVRITLLEADHAIDQRVSELLGEKQAMLDATIELSNVTGDAVLPDASKALGRLVVSATKGKATA